MPLFEIVLQRDGRSETAFAEHDGFDVGDTLLLDDGDWVVEDVTAPSHPSAYERCICVPAERVPEQSD